MPLRYEFSGAKRVPPLALAAVAITAAVPEHQNPDTNSTRAEIAPANVRYMETADNVALKPTGLIVHMRRRKHHKHHLTPAEIAAREVTPQEFREWSKVNVCEEGGNWHVSGSEYSGGLGISNVNWVNYGGQFFSQSAANATPDEQIVVAMRIQKNPPDQNGCTGSW